MLASVYAIIVISPQNIANKYVLQVIIEIHVFTCHFYLAQHILRIFCSYRILHVQYFLGGHLCETMDVTMVFCKWILIGKSHGLPNPLSFCSIILTYISYVMLSISKDQGLSYA